jgi:hypothetical protein
MKRLLLKFTRRFQLFVFVRSLVSIRTEVPLTKGLAFDAKKVNSRGKHVINFTEPRGRALCLNTYSNFYKASVPHAAQHGK